MKDYAQLYDDELDSALWPDLVLQMRKRKRYRQGGEAGGAKQSG